MAVIFALIGWLVRDWKLGVLSLALMTFIITVDMWGFAMDTLAMVLVAAFFALVIAIPVGTRGQVQRGVFEVVRPIMGPDADHAGVRLASPGADALRSQRHRRSGRDIHLLPTSRGTLHRAGHPSG